MPCSLLLVNTARESATLGCKSPRNSQAQGMPARGSSNLAWQNPIPRCPQAHAPPIPEARTMSNVKTLFFGNLKAYQTSCRGLTSPNHTLRASLRKSKLGRFEPSCFSRGEVWVKLTDSFFLYSLICYRFCIHVEVPFCLARIPSWETWESSFVAYLFN